MPNYKTTVTSNGQKHKTLKDILPTTPKRLDILFIAKTPAGVSVEAGHYFQGRQGKAFWNKLKNYNILCVRPNTLEDENLLENNYGITDIVKVPREYGNEPSDDEYRAGLKRVQSIIEKYNPRVIIFVYKRVLDQILNLGYSIKEPTIYGFNHHLDKIWHSKIFVFPMPGTPCNSRQGDIAMTELQILLKKKRQPKL